jgi:hypothetical protein
VRLSGALGDSGRPHRTDLLTTLSNHFVKLWQGRTGSACRVLACYWAKSRLLELRGKVKLFSCFAAWKPRRLLCSWDVL